MGTLYVANPTLQEQRVYYRLNFNPDMQGDTRALRAGFNFVDIPSGQQRPVGPRNAAPGQISEIIQQLEVYGALPVTDLGRQRQPISYLYDIDKYVKINDIRKAKAYNDGAKIEEGVDRRKKAAISINHMLGDTVEETPKDFAVGFEQLEEAGDNEKKIDEGYKVDANALGDHREPTPNRRGRPRRAATT
jgi:hypothetical protein